MGAQIQELANHYKLWNDFDEWYVEKATGVQVANDLGDEWAHIWAGFRYQVNPGDPWEEKRIDTLSWTWTTDSGAGWVKLIGDAYFAPGDTVHVHIEWILEDTDQLIEFKWKTTNDWQDVNDVQQIIRNGKIDVNGGGADCWYRFYKTDDTVLIGQLPADVSYNNITDSLKNRYKLIGNSKDIDWRWDETYDKNGTPTTSDVTVNVVDTNGVYGTNGYVEHVFNIGAVNQGEYIETIQHWHDAETYYLASFRNFETTGNGTYRPYGLSGGTGSQLQTAGGNGIFLNDGSARWVGSSFVASSNITIKQIEVKLNTILSPPGILSLEIYSDNGGEPGSAITNGIADTTYTEADIIDNTWHLFTFSSLPNLVNTTTYWVVIKVSVDGDGSNYFAFWYNNAGGSSLQKTDDSPVSWSEVDASAEAILRINFGDTLDSDKWFGMCYPTVDKSTHTINDADDKVAIKFTGVRSLDKVVVYITASANSPTLDCAIQGHSGAAPDGSDIANLSGTVAISGAGWHEVTFTGADLTEGTSYWLVCSIDSFGAGDSITFATATLAGEDLTSNWFEAYDEFEAAWAGNSIAECLCALMYGQSNAGLYNVMQYGTDENMLTGSGAITNTRWPTIKNDETTLYRTVIQIKPLGDTWQATRDADDEAWINESSGIGTVWDGFETAQDGSSKFFIDDGSGPAAAKYNIFVTDKIGSGAQPSEWNGVDAKIPATPGAAPESSGGLDQGDNRIECFEAGAGGNWEDDGCDNQIAEDDWSVWEFWYKVADEFVVDDEPEAVYYNIAGGGGVALAGLRWSYLVTADGGPANVSKWMGGTVGDIDKIMGVLKSTIATFMGIP